MGQVLNDYRQILRQSAEVQQAWLAEINSLLAPLSAAERVAWVLRHLPQQPMLSSSFGIQAAVMLHLVSVQKPDIPVVLTDTGYFPNAHTDNNISSRQASLCELATEFFNRG